MIRTMPGRARVVRSIGLMFCLTFGLGALAGCDRSQAPGPGPKPISSTPPQTVGSGASAPSAATR